MINLTWKCDMLDDRDITFLCGRAGVCALGAVVGKNQENLQMINYNVTQFKKVFEDEEFVKAADDTAEIVWKHGLLKRVGLCHGISGKAYVFLLLFRLTGNVEFLYKAKAFGCFLLDRAEKLISKGEMHGSDRPYSLFEGVRYGSPLLGYD